MNYIKTIVSLILCIPFYVDAMKHPSPKYAGQNSKIKNENQLIIKYRWALLNFKLPNDEKPILETQMYAVAHEEDQKSQEIINFLSNYLNTFAQSAYALRDPSLNNTEVGPEFNAAVTELYKDKDSLKKILQMHQYAKEQSSKQSSSKK